MQNTTNYSLPTWEQDDQIKMTDFNALTQKLDAALKSNADAVASESAARQTAVSAKADATALAAEISARESAVAAEQSARAGALAAVTKNLGAAGHNLRIAFGTYAGAGTYGSKNPCALSCGFYPVAAFAAPTYSDSMKNPTVFLRPGAYACALEGGSYGQLKVAWNDSGLTWYNGNTSEARLQLNASGVTYAYALLGYDKAAEEA